MRKLYESLLDNEDDLLDNTDINLAELPKFKNNIEIIIFIKAFIDNALSLYHNYKSYNKLNETSAKILLELFKNWAIPYTSIVKISAHELMTDTYSDKLSDLNTWAENLRKIDNRNYIEHIIKDYDQYKNYSNTFIVSLSLNIDDLYWNRFGIQGKALKEYLIGYFNDGNCTNNWSSSQKRKLQEYYKLIGEQIQKVISSYKIIK